MRPPTTSGLAITSLILGILGLCPCGGCMLGFAAVICGHIARAKTSSDPTVSGGGMALAGLIMGYISIAFMLVAWIISAATGGGAGGLLNTLGVKAVQEASVKYATAHDGKGPNSVEDLIAEKYLEASVLNLFKINKTTVSIEPFTSSDPDDKIIVNVTDEHGKVVMTESKGGRTFAPANGGDSH